MALAYVLAVNMLVHLVLHPPTRYRPMRAEQARHETAVSKLTEFYDLMGDLLIRTIRRSRRIQLAVLILSVVTTGTLWSLIATNFSNIAAWIGATITTLLSFANLYQATIGPERRIKEIQSIYDDAGEYLAVLVASQVFDYEKFADKLRRFESRVRSIETEHPASRMHAVLGQPGWENNHAIKSKLLGEVDELKEDLGMKSSADG
jgi:hypothetical protein